MVFKAQVIYPQEADTKFDMDYYLKTHMPLVQKHWGPKGLKKWEVIKINPTPDGTAAPYCVMATLTWEKGEDLGAAMAGEETKEIFGDIPNFCNKQPVFLAGDVVGEN